MIFFPRFPVCHLFLFFQYLITHFICTIYLHQQLKYCTADSTSDGQQQITNIHSEALHSGVFFYLLFCVNIVLSVSRSGNFSLFSQADAIFEQIFCDVSSGFHCFWLDIPGFQPSFTSSGLSFQAIALFFCLRSLYLQAISIFYEV